VLGKCGGYDSDIIAGMRWAAGLTVPGLPVNPNPARVINMSLGGSGTCDASNASAQPYIDVIRELGALPQPVVVVASAGNSAGHAASIPADCAGVIGVAGLRHIGTKVGFSDLGPEITISAQASDNSFNDSGAAFLTEGFAVGMTVTVSGFTTPANNLTGIITALTAGKMTIGGTDGDGIVDEAAGDSVTITSVARYDFLPITDAIPSLTHYYFLDGTRRIALGCRGNARAVLNAGEMPMLSFDFRGKDGGLAAVALPTDADFSAFMTPEIPTDANTLDLVIGGTISTTGAVGITGGTAIPSLGLEVNLGNDTPLVPLIGDESVDVVDRAVVATLRLSLSAAQEVARQLAVLGNTLSSVGLIHGTRGGSRVALWLSTAQFTNPQEEDFNGRAMVRYELRGVPDPAGTGNDEFRLVASF